MNWLLIHCGIVIILFWSKIQNFTGEIKYTVCTCENIHIVIYFGINRNNYQQTAGYTEKYFFNLFFFTCKKENGQLRKIIRKYLHSVTILDRKQHHVSPEMKDILSSVWCWNDKCWWLVVFWQWQVGDGQASKVKSFSTT